MLVRKRQNNVNNLALKDTEPQLELERVIGTTATHGSCLSWNPVDRTVAYPSGCVVVIYSPTLDKQKQYLFGRPNHRISCLSFSKDGVYLAGGECGRSPAVLVWEIATGNLVAELLGHRFGVNSVAFSPDGDHLLSLGDSNDRAFITWKWRESVAVRAMMNRTVLDPSHLPLSIDWSADSSSFVTCGHQHMEVWTLLHDKYHTNDPASPMVKASTVTGSGYTSSGLLHLEQREVKLGQHSKSTFVCAKFGVNCNAHLLFALDSLGILSVYRQKKNRTKPEVTGGGTSVQGGTNTNANGDLNQWEIEKWVNMKLDVGYSLSVTESVLAAGGGNGKVRLFDCSSLGHIGTLPSPHALGPKEVQQGKKLYPDTICVDLNADVSSMAVIMSDRTVMLWNTSERKNKLFTLIKSFRHHSGCIWDLQLPPSRLFPPFAASASSALPEGCFLTSSEDNTVRVWSLDASNSKGDNMISCIYAADDYLQMMKAAPLVMEKQSAKQAEAANSASSASASSTSPAASALEVPSTSLALSRSSNKGIRCVQVLSDSHASLSTAVSHDENVVIACGDKQGNVSFVNASTGDVLVTHCAHNKEVLSMHYSGAPLHMLATGSRDRLVHLFDTRHVENRPVATLQSHSSSITGIKFANAPAGTEGATSPADSTGMQAQASVVGGAGKDIGVITRLVSCSLDQAVVFRDMDADGSGNVHSLKKGVLHKGTVFDVDVHPNNRFAVSCGQDKHLRIWSLSTGKQFRHYKVCDGNVKTSNIPMVTTVQASAPAGKDGDSDKKGGVSLTNMGMNLGMISTNMAEVEAIKVSLDPSGTFIATTGSDKCARLFDWFTGACTAKVFGHSEAVTAVKFSRDCSRLISVSADGCIFVWRVASSTVRSMQDRLGELYNIPKAVILRASKVGLQELKEAGGKKKGTGKSLFDLINMSLDDLPQQVAKEKKAGDERKQEKEQPPTVGVVRAVVIPDAADVAQASARNNNSRWKQRVLDGGYTVLSDLEQGGAKVVVGVNPCAQGRAGAFVGDATLSLTPAAATLTSASATSSVLPSSSTTATSLTTSSSLDIVSPVAPVPAVSTAWSTREKQPEVLSSAVIVHSATNAGKESDATEGKKWANTTGPTASNPSRLVKDLEDTDHVNLLLEEDVDDDGGSVATGDAPAPSRLDALDLGKSGLVLIPHDDDHHIASIIVLHTDESAPDSHAHRYVCGQGSGNEGNEDERENDAEDVAEDEKGDEAEGKAGDQNEDMTSVKAALDATESDYKFLSMNFGYGLTAKEAGASKEGGEEGTEPSQQDEESEDSLSPSASSTRDGSNPLRQSFSSLYLRQKKTPPTTEALADVVSDEIGALRSEMRKMGILYDEGAAVPSKSTPSSAPASSCLTPFGSTPSTTAASPRPATVVNPLPLSSIPVSSSTSSSASASDLPSTRMTSRDSGGPSPTSLTHRQALHDLRTSLNNCMVLFSQVRESHLRLLESSRSSFSSPSPTATGDSGGSEQQEELVLIGQMYEEQLGNMHHFIESALPLQRIRQSREMTLSLQTLRGASLLPLPTSVPGSEPSTARSVDPLSARSVLSATHMSSLGFSKGAAAGTLPFPVPAVDFSESLDKYSDLLVKLTLQKLASATLGSTK